MNILVAMDSFKGCLSSWQAGQAVKEGLLAQDPALSVTVRPLADGGEGTVEALCAGLGGERVRLQVTGPLGEPVEAVYGRLEGGCAVLEMAAAAGLPLVPPERRDPLYTTTFGVGQLIRDALARGCRDFIVGIGGSATNDGGTGMLSALGYAFLDADGRPIPPGARGLERLARISDRDALPELKDCRFRIACDVNNPLCGPRGCSAVFGPQKGADGKSIQAMDRWLKNYARLTGELFPQGDENCPGAGAAGGLGFAFLAFLQGQLLPGVEIVLDKTGLEAAVREADLVFTGEGKLDAQTAMGKAPAGVARLAKKYGKKVVALAGCVSEDAQALHPVVDAFFSVTPGPVSLAEAMEPETARRNLKNTAEQVLRLWML